MSLVSVIVLISLTGLLFFLINFHVLVVDAKGAVQLQKVVGIKEEKSLMEYALIAVVNKSSGEIAVSLLVDLMKYFLKESVNVMLDSFDLAQNVYLNVL